MKSLTRSTFYVECFSARSACLFCDAERLDFHSTQSVERVERGLSAGQRLDAGEDGLPGNVEPGAGQ